MTPQRRMFFWAKSSAKNMMSMIDSHDLIVMGLTIMFQSRLMGRRSAGIANNLDRRRLF
ncbi:hypothetical protein [Methylocella tundrae]|uniref:Uncharacterized protein n=1 Tax=Methylocella tundrae TaxID=227605 RepID=A0A4U8Z1F7_METTU|nr:hypothetical protein [Methylocella tundrae]WPP03123.1 hypothetical protein SIN04_11525 [Methylocella tundrae]VFU09094.1 protein of unknown function [Methylocella tundrae]